MRLTLVVNNTADLNGGTKASCVFDESGGLIGSATGATWLLSDRTGSIDPEHLRVDCIDGHFCAAVLTPSGVPVNGSGTPVQQGETFRLSDGDMLQIGQFDVSVFISLESGDGDGTAQTEAWAKRFVSVGTLVGEAPEEHIADKNLFDARVLNSGSNVALHERLTQAGKTDPVTVLDEQASSRTTSLKDPVAVLDHDLKTEGQTMATTVDDYLNLAPEGGHAAALPDDHQPGSAYFAPPRPMGSRPATANAPSGPAFSDAEIDRYLDALAESAREPGQIKTADPGQAMVRDSWTGGADIGDNPEDEPLVDHVLLRPLCAALGLPVQNMTVPQANRLTRDVGEALRAAVTGLMEAHKRELSDKSHLAETHLHAIEDNPLRLDQTPEEALRDLFLVQSPVHLSASAAIQESLGLIRHHQRASEVASEEALTAILQALSPLALAKRFKKYKGHAPRAGDLDAWHWTMYRHYYAEMRSHQQGGLSRMFWEVYRQVYDREMRHLTSEA